MSVADALLLASLAPGQRRLRVALHPEPSWPMTALVSAGVASFFLAYFGVLVLFFLVGLPSPHASRLDGMSYTLSAFSKRTESVADVPHCNATQPITLHEGWFQILCRVVFIPLQVPGGACYSEPP